MLYYLYAGCNITTGGGMKTCDHCGTNEDCEEDSYYDLCLCKKCWDKHRLKECLRQEDIIRLDSMQDFLEKRVPPYDYDGR